MAEIYVSLRELKRLVAETDVTPFESGDLVAIPYGQHLLKAVKRRPARIFRNAIPMQAIGHSGVAHWWMRDFGGRQIKQP
jgi:hypothetical protein